MSSTILDIRHGRPMAIALIVVGVLLALTGVLVERWISVAAGAILAIVGTLQLVNPMIRVQQHEVQVRNPLGMTLKRFPIGSPADLAFDGKKLVHRPQQKKVMTLGFAADKSDVARLRQIVEGAGHGQYGQQQYGQQQYGQQQYGQPQYGQQPPASPQYGQAPPPPPQQQYPPQQWGQQQPPSPQQPQQYPPQQYPPQQYPPQGPGPANGA